MRSTLTALGLLLCTTSIAVAAPTSEETSASGNSYPVVVSEGSRVSARQVVPDAPRPMSATGTANASPLAQSRIIYLNRAGVQLTPGSPNDSRQNRSTIVNKTTAIPAWNVGKEVWEPTVQCMREMFAPFAVQVVTEDPGNVPHIEAIFGGSATQLGLSKGIVGISPFTSTCSTIENSIVFTFTDDLPADPRTVCEVMAQEVAHSFGLDHELLASDPMTYLPFSGKRYFQDKLASCGEKSERPCGINGSTCRAQQNSVQLLRERLGVADPQGPTGTVMSPANGQLVSSEFRIDVAATDNIAVSSVEFFIDGESQGVVTEPPYSLTVGGIAAGERVVTVVVSDQARNTVTDEISVTVEQDEEAGGCSATGSSGSSLGAFGLLALGLVAIRRRRR